MKDHFSAQAAAYAQFRPDYPESVIDFLASQVASLGNAWDCGTGNGQLAVKLAPHFEKVFATDISEAQLKHAPQVENIIYKTECAERTAFPDAHFDLVTVAQAIHWFSFEEFYREVYRVLKPEGLFAVVGYGLISLSHPVDAVIRRLYEEITGPYWDPARRYVDEEYATIPFPFEEIPAPRLDQRYLWSRAQLEGYLNTWSGLRNYVEEEGSNPLDLLAPDLKEAWGDSERLEVRFPILLRAGRKVF